jgi:hypothetical protein
MTKPLSRRLTRARSRCRRRWYYPKRGVVAGWAPAIVQIARSVSGVGLDLAGAGQKRTILVRLVVRSLC